jgi:hypothetical protein
MPEISETFFAVDRRTWRAWLREHHGTVREHRKNDVRRVLDARRAETRERRIREVVRRMVRNKKPGEA